MKKTLLALAIVSMAVSPALADNISGKWTTQSGETANITQCGGAYCIKLTTGKYSGKSIGKMSGSGNSYTGSITDPSNDKTYSGSATISGASMKMRGCVAKVLCRSQTWKKQ